MLLRRKLYYTASLLTLLLLAIETGLRIYYPALPSIAGLVGSRFEKAQGFGLAPSRCDEALPTQVSPVTSGIWVLGDSVTAGLGVPKPERFTTRIAEHFPELPVEVLSQEGADLCSEMALLARRLKQGPWPKVLVWEVLADDLVPYLVYSVNGTKVVFPESASSPAIGTLVQYSYFANLLFFEYYTHRRTTGNRLVNPATAQPLYTQLRALRALLERAKIPVIPVLLEPVGINDCPAETPLESPCNWMPGDLNTLAGMLKDTGYQPLDLRGLWKGQVGLRIVTEFMSTPPRMVAIHPNERGNKLLAAAIIPEVEKRIAAAP